MCGIVGYIGNRDAVNVLLGGLKRLEYRGYDSSGVAVAHPDGTLEMEKATGKIASLEKKLKSHPLAAHIGIAHTRWATHGAPTERNAHPQVSFDGKIMVVHNGIIENYVQIKKKLEADGIKFTSRKSAGFRPWRRRRIFSCKRCDRHCRLYAKSCLSER